MANAKRNQNGLTEKKQAAADLYRASPDPSIRGNAKRCYQIVYGCSEKSAEANGPRLFREPRMVEYLKHKRDQMMEAADITEERILRELACLAFLDPGEFYDVNGNLLPIHDMPERARRALTGLEVFEEYEGKGEDRELTGYTKKVKYNEKKPSLELFMKYKEMLKDKVEHSGEVKSTGVVMIPADMTPEQWLQKHYGQSQA